MEYVLKTVEFNTRDIRSTIIQGLKRNSTYNKQVNDTYGDDVLPATVDVIKRSIRKSDIFARYGGEGFMALQHKTVIEGAKVHAEKIRAAIE